MSRPNNILIHSADFAHQHHSVEDNTGGKLVSPKLL